MERFFRRWGDGGGGDMDSGKVNIIFSLLILFRFFLLLLQSGDFNFEYATLCPHVLHLQNNNHVTPVEYR